MAPQLIFGRARVGERTLDSGAFVSQSAATGLRRHYLHVQLPLPTTFSQTRKHRIESCYEPAVLSPVAATKLAIGTQKGAGHRNGRPRVPTEANSAGRCPISQVDELIPAAATLELIAAYTAQCAAAPWTPLQRPQHSSTLGNAAPPPP